MWIRRILESFLKDMGLPLGLLNVGDLDEEGGTRAIYDQRQGAETGSKFMWWKEQHCLYEAEVPHA